MEDVWPCADERLSNATGNGLRNAVVLPERLIEGKVINLQRYVVF